jgi:hypothetical protein
MSVVSHENLEDVFTYHPPVNDFQIEKYHHLRQAAKVCAAVMLDHLEQEERLLAIAKFEEVLLRETGSCRDQSEALAALEMARTYVKTAGAFDVGLNEEDAELARNEGQQSIIAAIRSALMWANASVALECLV